MLFSKELIALRAHFDLPSAPAATAHIPASGLCAIACVFVGAAELVALFVLLSASHWGLVSFALAGCWLLPIIGLFEWLRRRLAISDELRPAEAVAVVVATLPLAFIAWLIGALSSWNGS